MLYRVRDLLPKYVRRNIFRAGRFFGDASQSTHTAGLLLLSGLGFRPQFAIDVGAYHGDWAAEFRLTFPECRVLMIEGQQSKAEILRGRCKSSNGSIQHEIALLGPADGLSVRFVQMETGSSVFEENSAFQRCVQDRTTVTLDSLLQERGSQSESIDFLKLDVQGYELEVLKGAEKALARTEFVLMETSLIAVNRGCPVLADVLEFMTVRGFVLMDFLSQIRRKDGVLWQTDLLFVRSDSPLLPRPEFI